MIQLQNIEKVYRTDTVETLAINSISLDIAKGEFLSIMGPSGCGKSTLLNIMGLLDEPSKGNIKIDNQDISRFSDQKLANFRNQKLIARLATASAVAESSPPLRSTTAHLRSFCIRP